MSKDKDLTLRPVDEKRLDEMFDRHVTDLEFEDTWFIHTVLAQCFMPYRNPNHHIWERRNGDFAISIMAGRVMNPSTNEFQDVGLPYGAKPRLFQSYVCTQAIRQKSPVISVENSMTAMMKELGLKVTGGKNGSINSFKDQITRFAACHFTLVGPAQKDGAVRHIKAPPIKSMDIWFPSSPDQTTLWPSEITLTDDYFYSLKDHAIPYDFRALKAIQNNARAQDVYLWLTQRLCRIPYNKPLFMTWDMLREMFGGGMKNTRMFPAKFRETMKVVYLVYPEAKMNDEKDGFRFYHSPPPIARKNTFISQPKSEEKQIIAPVEHKKAAVKTPPIKKVVVKKGEGAEKATMESLPVLDTETYESAKKAAPGYDVYYLENQWRASWKNKGRAVINNPDKAFIGYCKACYKNAPNG